MIIVGEFGSASAIELKQYPVKDKTTACLKYNLAISIGTKVCSNMEISTGIEDHQRSNRSIGPKGIGNKMN
jgi:hypothetical protein